jgi:hypothetical protein
MPLRAIAVKRIVGGIAKIRASPAARRIGPVDRPAGPPQLGSIARFATPGLASPGRSCLASFARGEGDERGSDRRPETAEIGFVRRRRIEGVRVQESLSKQLTRIGSVGFVWPDPRRPERRDRPIPRPGDWLRSRAFRLPSPDGNADSRSGRLASFARLLPSCGRIDKERGRPGESAFSLEFTPRGRRGGRAGGRGRRGVAPGSRGRSG